MSNGERGSAQHIGDMQLRQQREEFRGALRALLMQPLMTAAHEYFPAVRRQAEALRDWFSREAGWVLQVEREGARLYKHPADLADATRGLADYDRRRYILLCLACAVLERSDSQITLHVLGERLLELAADPALVGEGFEFSLRSASERRELVGVCRSLLELGVLQRVAGNEDGFVRELGNEHGDALYDVRRRTLAGVLAAVRGPSTWAADTAPRQFEARLESLLARHIADSEDGRRTALRHALTRRLLDDPVVYLDTLDPAAQAYFINQRGVMASRLCEGTGLHAEQRAEGLALTDDSGAYSDVAMPAEGTEAHVTLLVAEFLARPLRGAGIAAPTYAAVEAFVREAIALYGQYWRKSAREPGAEQELTSIALRQLNKLNLVALDNERISPRAAISRFALGQTELTSPASDIKRKSAAANR